MPDFENFPTEHSQIIQKIKASKITAKSPAAELKEALLVVVAAYMDYSHYSNGLGKMLDDFDESLEEFDPNTWFFRGTEKADALATDCYNALSSTASKFSNLARRAEESCAVILKAALSSPPDVQKASFGRAYQITPDEMDGRISELFDAAVELEYHESMQENLASFLSLAEEIWIAEA